MGACTWRRTCASSALPSLHAQPPPWEYVVRRISSRKAPHLLSAPHLEGAERIIPQTQLGGGRVPIKHAMDDLPSSRLAELVETSETRLTILRGALTTLQVPDPRLGRRVVEAILASAVHHAGELETLLAGIAEQVGIRTDA